MATFEISRRGQLNAGCQFKPLKMLVELFISPGNVRKPALFQIESKLVCFLHPIQPVIVKNFLKTLCIEYILHTDFFSSRNFIR